MAVSKDDTPAGKVAPKDTAKVTETRATGSVPAGVPAAAPGRVVADAARKAESERLRKERDELRERLDGAGADDLVMLRAEVDALRQAAAKAGAHGQPKHMSEGVRQDLEMHGYAVDPATGAALVLDRDSGEVTVTPRHGRAVQIDMPEEPDTEREPKA